MWLLIASLIILVIIAWGIGGVYLIAYLDAKNEVRQMPREPMLLCEVHGAFPAKYAVKLDVEHTETGQIEMCPFCAKERVSKKEVPA